MPARRTAAARVVLLLGLLAVFAAARRPRRSVAPEHHGIEENDPTVVEYEARRRALVAELAHTAFAASALTWSEAEERAAERVAALRREVVEAPGYYDAPLEQQLFVDVRPAIANTSLFEWLQRMPKGAMLHVHSDAMGDYSKLVDLAASYIDNNGGRFFVDVNTTAHKQYFVLSQSSPGGSYLLLSEAMLSQELRDRIVDDLLITGDEVRAALDVWPFFGPIFQRVSPLLEVPALMLAYYEDAFHYLSETDHLLHVEIRGPWRTENEGVVGTKEHTIIAALGSSRGGNGKLTLRAIYSDTRHVSTSQDLEKVKSDISYVGTVMAKAAAMGAHTYLAGYDLVGEEDTGLKTLAFIKEISSSVVSNNGRLFPTFFFHNGESDLPPQYDGYKENAQGLPSKEGFNNNLVDAYLVNTMTRSGSKIHTGRVGHGIDLFKTPTLMRKYRETGIALELCPVSNQILRYVDDIREHPGQVFLAEGLPVTLSPDDPAIYGYQGLTYDFWEVCVAWNLGLKELKLLAYYSLQHSALSTAEKEEMLLIWHQQWHSWVTKING